MKSHYRYSDIRVCVCVCVCVCFQGYIIGIFDRAIKMTADGAHSQFLLRDHEILQLENDNTNIVYLATHAINSSTAPPRTSMSPIGHTLDPVPICETCWRRLRLREHNSVI